jgi:cytochrome P450/NADPH-cytochrome P450 reductase
VPISPIWADLINVDRAAGRDVGTAMLFYGCRSSDTDLLYDDEMQEWERQGVVKVYHAFSRDSDRTEGCKYVQYVA